jgi:hypothetical protein
MNWYKIKHILFGWDYVYWKSNIGYLSGISRVERTFDGRVVYNNSTWYHTSIVEIKHKEQVHWLTCKPSDYGFE